MSVRIAMDLGIVKVENGILKDPQRISKIIGNLPSSVQPNPHWFIDLDKWPQGQTRERLLVVALPQECFSNVYCLNKRLQQENYLLKGFPHLCAVLKIRNIAKKLRQEQIYYLEATDPKFFVKHAGRVCAPLFDSYPFCPKLLSCDALRKRGSWNGWLVGLP